MASSSSSSLALSNTRDFFLDENLPYHTDIFLSEKIYNPGDIIHGETGNANFRPLVRGQKKILIDETTILWSDQKIDRKKFPQQTLNDFSRLSSTTTTIRAKEHDRNENFRGIKIGNHKFEFTFQLPKQGLHTSFDLRNCGGRIRYCINVQCFSYDRLVLKKTLIFPIVCPVSPSECPKALENGYCKKRLEFKKGNYFDVELSISKRWLVPGEALPVQIYIDNRSGKSIKFSHLSIQQHIICTATHPITYSKEWFQDTLGVGMDIDKIPNGSMHKYIPKFNVPALIPGFEIDRCITLEYALKLDIGFDRITVSNGVKHIICTLTIPIFIGTSSTTDANLVQKSKFEEAIVSPPNYYDIQPPSYDDCVAKLPIIKEMDNH